MAATLADSVWNLSLSQMVRALDNLTPGSIAYNLLDDAIAATADHDPDEDGSDAYVRMLENRGFDDARFEEEMNMMRGLPA